MEKNTLLGLGILGALGVGAYLYFTNQDQRSGAGGSGGGGNFYEDFYKDFLGLFNPSSNQPASAGDGSSLAAKKVIAVGGSPAVSIPNALIADIPAGVVKSGPGVAGYLIKGSTDSLFLSPGAEQTADFINKAGIIINGAPAGSTTKKAAVPAPSIVTPTSGTRSALITIGTPAQQIEQFNIAPKIYKGKKVM